MILEVDLLSEILRKAGGAIGGVTLVILSVYAIVKTFSKSSVEKDQKYTDSTTKISEAFIDFLKTQGVSQNAVNNEFLLHMRSMQMQIEKSNQNMSYIRDAFNANVESLVRMESQLQAHQVLLERNQAEIMMMIGKALLQINARPNGES